MYFYSIIPSKAYQGLEFIIDDINGIEIDNNIIYSKKAGSYKITLKTIDGSNITKIINVNVIADEKTKFVTNSKFEKQSVLSWRKWADQQNFISPLLLQWLSMPESENMSGGKFYYMDPNEDIDSSDVTKLMCTPRSWTNAMRELAEYSNTGTLEGFTIFDIDRDILAMTLNQYVPADAVDSFLAFLEVISKIGNFDDAVYDVWQNGGKAFKLNKKDLNKIVLPLGQLICSAHSDALPTQKEFENLAKWLVDQKSDQLASCVLDVFKNIFFDNAPGCNSLFIFGSLVKKYGVGSKELAIKSNAFRPIFDKWGVDEGSMPDYSTGLKTLGAAYGASFKAAVVDGWTDALG